MKSFDFLIVVVSNEITRSAPMIPDSRSGVSFLFSLSNRQMYQVCQQTNQTGLRESKNGDLSALGRIQ
jgi:hypothetical protein